MLKLHVIILLYTGCLNKLYSNTDDDREDYSTSNSQRKRSSINNQPPQLYTDDSHVYDRTHENSNLPKDI